jgi:hypothetical protein
LNFHTEKPPGSAGLNGFGSEAFSSTWIEEQALPDAALTLHSVSRPYEQIICEPETWTPAVPGPKLFEVLNPVPATRSFVGQVTVCDKALTPEKRQTTIKIRNIPTETCFTAPPFHIGYMLLAKYTAGLAKLPVLFYTLW